MKAKKETKKAPVKLAKKKQGKGPLAEIRRIVDSFRIWTAENLKRIDDSLSVHWSRLCNLQTQMDSYAKQSQSSTAAAIDKINKRLQKLEEQAIRGPATPDNPTPAGYYIAKFPSGTVSGAEVLTIIERRDRRWWFFDAEGSNKELPLSYQIIRGPFSAQDIISRMEVGHP